MAGIFFDYVIAGASRSGLSCAETIRANDDSGSILVVSKEKVLPYKRTKLSKRLFQGYSEEDFLLYPRSWYTDQRISLYLGTGAVDLAPEINTLFLDDGRKIGYGKLCIATGGSPLPVRVPGNPPVYYLREKEDGRELYKHASGWKRVCVIGNGIQGIELSEQFVKMGKQVDIAGRTPRAMQGKVDPAMSRLITETLTSNNVGITSYKDLEDKQISSRYDGIAASVGIFPETAWLESSGLNLCPGVVIDKGCRTSHQDIYAAGDVTEPLLPFTWGMWHGAEYQGQCAGRAMTGADVNMKLLPFRIKLDLFGKHFYSLWYSPPMESDPEVESILITPGKEIEYCRLLSKQGRIAAALFCGAEYIGKTILSPLIKANAPLNRITRELREIL